MGKPLVLVTLVLAVLVVQPLGTFVTGAPASFEPPTTGPYHTYDTMVDMLTALAANHSAIMSVQPIGTTFQNRSLWMVKISDNVASDETETEVLLMGAHHGNERPSYEVCLAFVQYLAETYDLPETDTDGDGLLNEDPFDGLDNDLDTLFDEDPAESDVREIVDTTEIFVLPMVNPDGVEAGTRKNREPNFGPLGHRSKATSVGVDLRYNSRQFLGFSPVYRGERPFSERETAAVKAFVENRSLTLAVTYHTFGELVLFPWSCSRREPRDEPTFRMVGENVTKINGYDLAQSIELYPTIGDACDWMYGTHGIIAFTIELAESYAPQDPWVVQDLCWRHIGVNLKVCSIAQTLA